MAKSSSPPVEPRPPQLSLPPPVQPPLIPGHPAHIPLVPPTISEILNSTEPPQEPPGSVYPDIVPPTDLVTTGSGLAAIETAVVEDVAMPIESIHLPDAIAPHHAHSASVAQSTATIFQSEPADVATGNVVSISSAAVDDAVAILDSSSCPAPTETTPTDVVGSLVDTPDWAAPITPFDLPHDQLVPQSTNGLEATFYLAALDTTIIEELDHALVSLRPTTSIQRFVKKAQTAENTLETECLLADEIPSLTDDSPTVSTDTHDEPYYADAQYSPLPTSPPALVPLLAPVVELAFVKENVGIMGGNDYTSADSPPSPTPRSQLSNHVERELESTNPVEKAEPIVEDVVQSDVASIVCAPSATQDGLTSPEVTEVDQSNTAGALVPIPTLEDTLHCVDVLVPILPVSLSSSVLPLCAAPHEAEVVSPAPQSRECSLISDTKMEVEMEAEVETTHLVASEDSTMLLPLDLPEDVVMEVDTMEFDDLDEADTTTSAEDIPEFADADLDLPPSSPRASSSPPYIFSSSPPRDFYSTPPSSSPPVADMEQFYPEISEHTSTEETKHDALVNHGSLKRSAPDVLEAAPEEERRVKQVVRAGMSDLKSLARP